MISDKNTITVNLLGIGCRVFIIKSFGDLFKRLSLTANKLAAPLEQALFDAEFFKTLENEKFKNISDLSELCIGGLLKDDKSQIEIRIGGRKKRTILISELIDDQTLIPLFDANIRDFGMFGNAITAIEKEVGMIASYKIDTQKFDLDKVKFELIEIDTGIEKLLFLHRVFYDGKLLKSVSNDTLVTSNYAIINIGSKKFKRA